MLTDKQFEHIHKMDGTLNAALNEAYRIGVAAERKRCAAVCRDHLVVNRSMYDSLLISSTREQCAQAIERGEDAK